MNSSKISPQFTFTCTLCKGIAALGVCRQRRMSLPMFVATAVCHSRCLSPPTSVILWYCIWNNYAVGVCPVCLSVGVCLVCLSVCRCVSSLSVCLSVCVLSVCLSVGVCLGLSVCLSLVSTEQHSPCMEWTVPSVHLYTMQEHTTTVWYSQHYCRKKVVCYSNSLNIHILLFKAVVWIRTLLLNGKFHFGKIVKVFCVI